VASIWESPEQLNPRNNAAEATYFWKSDPRLDTPDLQTIIGESPIGSPEAAGQFNIPAAGWTMLAGIVRPESRGYLRLISNNPQDPIQIDHNRRGGRTSRRPKEPPVTESAQRSLA
jgi:choline dehydrogenase